MKLFLLFALLGAAQAVNICPDYVRNLPPESSCLSSFGACKSSTCLGNNINKNAVERICTIEGGENCPWNNVTWGLSCAYNPKCVLNEGNNCFGYTVCAKGVCPVNTVGLVCIENSVDSFKLCGCNNVDCVVGEFTPWSMCVNRNQYRSRKVVVQQQGVGASCPNLYEYQTCTQNTDCVVSPWNIWGVCVRNIQVRDRTVLVQSSGNGTKCPSLVDTQSCGCDLNVTNYYYNVTYNKVFNVPIGNVDILVFPKNGVLVKSEDAFTYKPNLNYCGADQFTFRVKNGDCFKKGDVSLNVPCGCGSSVGQYECVLDSTQPSTQCVLPGGQVVLVPNLPRFRRVILTVNAKLSYKTK